nr:P2ab polyprotein [Cynosurus mottle virus]
MAFSVAGLTERSVLRNSLVIGLVLLVSTWNQWKESPNAGRLWLAIPLLLVCNWIVWKVSIVAQRHLLGVTTEVRRPRDMATIQSPPRFDPLHGFVASALYQGAIIEVVMDVCTAFSSSPKLDQGLTPEMAMPNSPTNRVAPNSEPDSLVTLYRDGAVIGFGARIKTPRGENLLLTAYHVWELEPEHMAKRGKCIPLRKCRLVYKSTSEMLDFAMVEVPSSYWTSVGVKSAHLKKSGARTVVRAFGGQSSQDLFSTSGVATYGKTPLELVHTATTFPGWSGTPLYSKGNVVGLHFGSEKAKLKNRACNIAGLFEILPRNVEVESSVMADDSSQQELEHAEWVERMKQGVPYEQYEINDEDYMVGHKDYHRLAHFDAERRLNDPSYRSWADRADSDDESLGSIYETPIEVETSREVDEFHECEEPENPSSPPTSAERVRTPVPEVRVDVMMEESRVRPLLARKSSPAPKVLTESSARAASPRLDIGRVEKSTASQRVQKETNVPLNLPAGGLLEGMSALSQLAGLGGYSWVEGDCINNGGMRFLQVGRSDCWFRETSRKAISPDIRAAAETFPELASLGWPDRGSSAERRSLLFQAGRFERVEAPKGLQEACSRLASRYPKTKPRACFRVEPWQYADVRDEVSKVAFSQEINRKASPGVPLSMIAQSNGQVLDWASDLVVQAVVERLHVLAAVDPRRHGWGPEELVQRGLCDPVRLFVKQEPHTQQKIDQGRFRLISSVSLVDQLVERMLFGPQNSMEIATWFKVPSKPGMGLATEAQVSLLWADLKSKHSSHPAAEADISGFDWSVQDWELWADLSMRIELGDFPSLLRKAAISRFYCFMNSVFQFSSGEMIAQLEPGLMKSGSYCTSSTNSRIRCLMAELIGSPWCIAMGDDSVEGWTPGAKEAYSALGHTCKEYYPCGVNQDGSLAEVNFCSHRFTSRGSELTTWAKTLFRFLSSPDSDFEDLWVELESSRMWPSISRYLRRIGRVSDKDGEENSTDPREEPPVEPNWIEIPVSPPCEIGRETSWQWEHDRSLSRWLFG